MSCVTMSWSNKLNFRSIPLSLRQWHHYDFSHFSLIINQIMIFQWLISVDFCICWFLTWKMDQLNIGGLLFLLDFYAPGVLILWNCRKNCKRKKAHSVHFWNTRYNKTYLQLDLWKSVCKTACKCQKQFSSILWQTAISSFRYSSVRLCS